MRDGNSLEITDFYNEYDKNKRILFLEKEKYYKPKFYNRCSKISRCEKEIILNNFNLYKNDNIVMEYIECAKVGTYMHELVQSDLVNCGIVEQNMLEFKIEDSELSINGHCDFITTSEKLTKLIDPNLNILGEIKTVTDEKFKKVISTNKPLPYHLPQTNIYLDILDRLYFPDIEYTFFIYKNRSNMREHYILYKKNKKTISKLKQKSVDIKSYFENKKIPLKKYNEYDFGCNFCRYTNICCKINSFSDIIEFVKK